MASVQAYVSSAKVAAPKRGKTVVVRSVCSFTFPLNIYLIHPICCGWHFDYSVCPGIPNVNYTELLETNPAHPRTVAWGPCCNWDVLSKQRVLSWGQSYQHSCIHCLTHGDVQLVDQHQYNSGNCSTQPSMLVRIVYWPHLDTVYRQNIVDSRDTYNSDGWHHPEWISSAEGSLTYVPLSFV